MYRQTTATDPLHEPRTALRLSIADAREKLATLSDAPLLACDVPSPTHCTPVRQAELLDAVEDIARHAPLIAHYPHNRWRATTPPLDQAWVAAAPARLSRVADVAAALVAHAGVLASTLGTPIPDSLAQVDLLITYAERYPALCAAERRLGEIYVPSLYDLDLPSLAQRLTTEAPAWRRRLPGAAYAGAIAAVKKQAWPSHRHDLTPEVIVRDVHGALAVAATRRGSTARTALTWAEFAALTDHLASLLDAAPCGADHPEIGAALRRVVAERDAVRGGLGDLSAALDLRGAWGDGQPPEDVSLTTVATVLRDLTDHAADLLEVAQVEQLRRQAAAEGLESFFNALLTHTAMGAALTPSAIFHGFERCFYQRWLTDAQEGADWRVSTRGSER